MCLLKDEIEFYDYIIKQEEFEVKAKL